MNLMILTLIILSLPLIHFLSGIRFEKVDVTKLSEEEQDRILKSHPTLYWKLGLIRSFDKYTKEMQDLINWWATAEHNHKITYNSDKQMAALVAKTTTEIIGGCCNKMRKMHRLRIWLYLRFYKPDALTKKLFGKDIVSLYFSKYILEHGKERLENPKALLDEDILSQWKWKGQLKNLKVFEPVFTESFMAEAVNYSQNLSSSFGL